jgi:hypothetical protein
MAGELGALGAVGAVGAVIAATGQGVRLNVSMQLAVATSSLQTQAEAMQRRQRHLPLATPSLLA